MDFTGVNGTQLEFRLNGINVIIGRYLSLGSYPWFALFILYIV